MNWTSRLVSVLAVLLGPSSAPAQETGSGVEPRREYNVVDFLWSGSGSGSGSGEDGPGTPWLTTTVFRTRVQTLLLATPVLQDPCSPCPSASICPCPVEPACSSSSCYSASTPGPQQASPRPNKLVPHQRYWLLTVIRVRPPVPDIHVFEKRLENLYRLAFLRQQEKHLRLEGSDENVSKRSAQTEADRQVVSVKMHHFRRRLEDQDALMELIYSVAVSGSTVDALAATHDINYLSDSEVSAQLGFPVLTKAQPYYKVQKSVEVAGQGNIWIFIIIGICVGFLLLVFIVFYLIVVKRKSLKDMGRDEDEVDPRPEIKPVLTKPKHTPTTPHTRGEVDSKTGAGSKFPETRPPTAITDSVPKDSTKSSYSPKSFLSMPSVRAFPRGDCVSGPLDQMLETESGSTRSLSRHHSEVADPGVIGPAVWNLHCHRISKIERDRERAGEWEGRAARRRFHQLLDDAFSLFPSENCSPEPPPTAGTRPSSGSRVYDAQEERPARRQPAWEGRPGEPRPLSAGPFHKVEVEPSWMLADSTLKPSDAAAPLIQAIKQELDKFPSVPSSRI